MIPGEYILRSEPIQANVDRETCEIEVANHGDRPIQAAGTAVRFEPGDCKRVTLVAFAGTGEVYGLNSLCNGPLTEATREAAMQRALEQGFGNTEATGGTA